MALVQPITEYKLYVARSLAELVKETEAFTAAVKAGDVAKAKALFAPTRTHYEKIEPIAELFSDLDGSMDSRADDHELAEKDPASPASTASSTGCGMTAAPPASSRIADQLMADVDALQAAGSTGLVFPPEVVVGGAAALMEEVAATKISGEEDRYSRTDLWDFQANADGSKKIWQLFSPLLTDDSRLCREGQREFRHRRHDPRRLPDAGEGFESYEKLSDADRTKLSGAVNTLAEDLSQLKGKLGLG